MAAVPRNNWGGTGWASRPVGEYPLGNKEEGEGVGPGRPWAVAVKSSWSAPPDAQTAEPSASRSPILNATRLPEKDPPSGGPTKRTKLPSATVAEATRVPSIQAVTTIPSATGWQVVTGKGVGVGW